MKTIHLDKSLPVPLYHQLKTVLIEKLRQGEWKPHEQLPTEDEMGIQFGVSKATVRQALRDLAQQGLVRREQGRGTFVSDAKIQFGPRQLTSFTEEMKAFGLQAGSGVIEQKIVAASGEIAHKLGIPAGADVYYLHRLRLAGGEPMGLQTVHIASALVPDLIAVNLGAASLYETLEQRYNLVADHATQHHFALSVNAEQAALLRVPVGAAVLGGERLSFLRDGRPLELTYSLMRGDRYQIELRLTRGPVPLQ